LIERAKKAGEKAELKRIFWRRKVIEKQLTRKHMIVCWVVVLFVAGMGVYAQSAIVIPTQVQSTLESVQKAFTGDLARIIVGICFAGSCIAYAYNKDNEKMKAKLIAVMVGTGLLALSQTIVDNVMKIAS
jgi:hypothetical protein